MAIIGAEVLGISPDDFRVVSGDTDSDPLDVGAFTQRGTFNTGNATKNACLDARNQLSVTAAQQLGVDPEDLVFRDRQVYPDGEPERAIPFRKVAFDTLHSLEGRFVMGRGFYNSPIEKGTMAYSFRCADRRGYGRSRHRRRDSRPDDGRARRRACDQSAHRRGPDRRPGIQRHVAGVVRGVP